jgi:hypothetical protein
VSSSTAKWPLREVGELPATRPGHRRRTAPAAVAARSWQDRCRTAWATTLTCLLGLLFTGLTAVTVTLWATDPTYTQTNPVVDLSFFAVGGILITVGFASQIGRTPRVAGLQQAILALAALAAAGWLGGRIEPFIGALVLLVAAAPLVVLHPGRRQLLTAGPRGSGTLFALSAVAAGPAVVYATDMLDRARAAGPSCFLGQCVQGDRYAEAAALALGVVLVALLASMRTPGWMLPAGSAGAAAVVLGAASLLWRAEVGAVSGAWAGAALSWGCAFVAVAYVQHESPNVLAAHDEKGR